MVTGKKAFEGKSQVGLIGAILERDPAPVSTIQPTSPRRSTASFSGAWQRIPTSDGSRPAIWLRS